MASELNWEGAPEPRCVAMGGMMRPAPASIASRTQVWMRLRALFWDGRVISECPSMEVFKLW